MAPILAMPVEDIRSRLMAPGSFTWIKRTLEPAAAKAVIALIKEQNISGLEFIEESKRNYPNNRLAAQVLGIVGTDDIGLDGIEMTLNETIKGNLQSKQWKRTVMEFPFSNPSGHFIDKTGKECLSYNRQYSPIYCDGESLDRAMDDTKALAATVILMNPRTGEILAMASRPTYDPNEFYRYSEINIKTGRYRSDYKPGSTFKAVVAAAALQEKLVVPNEPFVDNGFVEVSGRRIQNWDREKHGNVRFTDIMDTSINTGFVQVGMRIGAVRLTQYTRAFGFGQATGIELPGEEGMLFDPEDNPGFRFGDNGYRTEYRGNPTAVINGDKPGDGNKTGVLLKPHIIKEIDNADGTVVSLPQPNRSGRWSPGDGLLAALLEKVVSTAVGKGPV